jgi:EAL and modified HD-GYP domain-containing signal transduction protein
MGLLRLTNSVATGAKVRVNSLGQAINVLGRRQLQRWLQLLLYATPTAGSFPNALLQLAATRGRLMELLAAQMHPGDQDFEDRAFMTGIMSLVPALMKLPLTEILQGIRLAKEVRAALETNGGQLGSLLKLTEALEGMVDADYAALTSALPGLDGATVSTCLSQALAWSNEVGQGA